MNFKKIINKILFPHIAISVIFLLASVVLLIYSFGSRNPNTIISYISYGISAYTLTIWCCRIPELIRFAKKQKNENKYIIRWFSDIRLRVNVSLYGGFIWNTAYAVLQIGLGFTHNTFWFFSLAAYYFSLAVMRFFLLKHTSKFNKGEQIETELIKYRNCGIALLIMNLALSLMIFFMVYWNRTFYHNEITTIALAAYSFTSLTIAIINVIKYRSYESPVYLASKVIGLAAALVSILTLESAMLNTFNDGTMTDSSRRILLGVSGTALSLYITGTAIYMIASGNKKLKNIK